MSNPELGPIEKVFLSNKKMKATVQRCHLNRFESTTAWPQHPYLMTWYFCLKRTIQKTALNKKCCFVLRWLEWELGKNKEQGKARDPVTFHKE